MTDDATIDLLKAVAHPSRLAILECIAGQERSVGEIEAATGIGQPALSQQLSVLRKAGLVTSRREAKLVFYVLEPDAVSRAVAPLAALIPQKDAPPRAASKRMGTGGGAAVFAQLD